VISLVTGGSRGLGRAIALALARRGGKVAFTWTRDEAAAHETLAQLSELGPARAFRCSVLDAAGTAAVLAEIEREWGGLDVLVNNAAITQNLPLPLLEEEDFDKVMDINVKGTYLTSRAAARTMIRRKKGTILNIGSLAGERILDAPIHYCTSKAAISGMTRAFAKELSRHGVRVLCLAPGLLEEGVGRNVPEHRREDYLRHCALGRLGTLAEIAELAALLVCDASMLASGATLVADGGL
jgi:3-oxoacyl-[acyl-carrier protein] reductase